MLQRIRQVENIGRFVRMAADDAPFGRLTLIHGRNASGKSTLARVLAATAARSAEQLALDRTLDARRASALTLELAEGACRYDGAAWSGPTPSIRVFDRGFVEANVHVGRTTSKEQRKGLLAIALGAVDVATARELDALTARGRELARERHPHQAVLTTAAAMTADDRARRPCPSPLPRFQPPDLVRLRDVLARTAHALGTDAEARVRRHLADRLGGHGEPWIRDGLRHVDGATCPFCDQDVRGVDLLADYARWFGRGYDALVADVDQLRGEVTALLAWWDEVKQVGRGNVAALAAWSDLVDARPHFDSPRREADVHAAEAAITALVDAKRRRPLDAVPDADLTSQLAILERTSRDLAAATDSYNAAVAAVLTRIDSPLADCAAAPRDPAATRTALAALARLDDAQRANDRAKEAAADRLKATATRRLSAFVRRLDALLAILGADFRIDQLAPERVGGATGARFTVRLEHGALHVAGNPAEARLARVLSDGDRSTLALAVFLLSLDDLDHLDDTIVVLDDPATSQDAHRARATAHHLAHLATRVRQLIVLSHDARFLSLLADASHLPSSDLVELELDRDTHSLRRPLAT